MSNQDFRDLFSRLNEDRRETLDGLKCLNEKIDKLAERISKIEVSVTEKIASMPANWNKMIQECQHFQDKKRRWSIGTIIAVFFGLSSFVISLFALKGCA